MRGREIGAVFQDPLTSLNPLYTVGRQLVETIRTHLPMGEAERAQARDRPARGSRHSGGRRAASTTTRTSSPAACASAWSSRSRSRRSRKLIVADEPTTALDVSIQAQIIQLLKRPVPRARHRGDAGHARHGRDRRDRRSRRRDVRRAHRRDRPGGRRDPPAAASVHGRAHGIDPVDRRGARAADADRRRRCRG